MAFTRLTDHIDALGNHIEAYVTSMFEYYKLSFFKKFMKGFSMLTKLLIVGSIFLFFLGFISIAFAIWIGVSIDSLSGGFFIVGGFYFLAFIALMIFWKKLIEGIFLDKFSRFVFNDEDELEGKPREQEKPEVEKSKEQPDVKENDTSWRTDF